ncbi:XTP/dITP diphosphatase [Nonomuraea africana]|uniref:dITP/XTP pyrophosphatase n=1 Tax=Nonomuraea africana TaxID=46171 RepID=A0ABR9KW72_9ACTN|nr:XTP/dITP diphosphatase [Nonomuraea africana]MBE1566289.1 XTP/dITP diphosphohydrolase [Nonomuraea africana]
MRIVLATRNAGKIVELRRILGGFEVVGLEEFPEIGEVAETGLTFAENALLKAHAVAQGSGLPAVADDSGLCVDALNGMPGVFSARWSGKHGDDDANLDLLLAQVSDVPDERRTAHFTCSAALALPSGEERVVEGVLEGRLLRQRRGTNGFGYDPIFVPDGETRTTAEMSAEEKDAISHRGRAFRALAPIVASLLS